MLLAQPLRGKRVGSLCLAAPLKISLLQDFRCKRFTEYGLDNYRQTGAGSGNGLCLCQPFPYNRSAI
jgi:hypothetical protein